MMAALACLLLVMSSLPIGLADPLVHCANADGAFIGLVADDTYTLRLPADAPTNPEKWTRVEEASVQGTFGQQPATNSFTGTYVQVLPDDRDSYNQIYGIGSFRMTGLDFQIDVRTPGVHTLFLRWTGGDTVGGGDSLYAVMRDARSDVFMTGAPTFKPKLVDIKDLPGMAGCCYNAQKHTCECHEEVQEQEAGVCDFWSSRESASRRGVQCKAGNGEMVSIDAPRWYLFAGQESGNVMDFDAEPWDATCEAEGTGTADTALDFAAWNLPVGSYRLVFYPREDGTAIDAFYLAGPGVEPPTGLRLEAGASTTDCNAEVKPALPVGGGIVHQGAAASGWGYRRDESDPTAPAGAPCGVCLVPIDSSECPTPEELETMQTCDTVQPNELCEADGECGTNVRLNNCNPPATAGEMESPSSSGSGHGPRQRGTRNNDVYRRLSEEECKPHNKGMSGGVVALLVLIALGATAAAAYFLWLWRSSVHRLILGVSNALPITRRKPMAAATESVAANAYVRRDDLQRVASGQPPLVAPA